ncbi:MAG: hypothetical protein KZQ99_22700 [Candidatus Thiodiazotropha sp. (ex Dulcina madagascariensis)]|nr:hypothetical protein [Candidatus Thiodiazotropha sp. (ex Dulcina madagascariensis)]
MTPAKTLVAKLVIASLALFVSSPLWAADHGFCEAYARQALTQFEEAQGEGCENLNYPVWSMDFRHHYDWCRTVSRAQAEKGDEQRVDVLRQCRGRAGVGRVTGTAPAVNAGRLMETSLQRACREYADGAVSQQRMNLQSGCGFSGPQWNGESRDHYNWCLHGENLKFTQGEHDRRQAALAQCHATKDPARMKGSDAVLDRTQYIQLDQAFIHAVDRAAAGLDKKLRDIQDEAWSRARNRTLDRFNTEVKAAAYDHSGKLPGLPGRPDRIGQSPDIIGEIDKRTGQVNRGAGRSKAPQECNGVRYDGPPRITHILSSTKADNYFVTPGDKLIIFGDNFYATPGRVEIQLPQGGGFLDIPLRPGNMANWNRSWTDQVIVADVPKLKGLFEPYHARIGIMITHPCSGQAFAYHDIKLTPRMELRQISGSTFLELAKGEDEDKAIDTKLEHKHFVKVSHYPGCGVKIPVIGAMSGSGEEGDDYFFNRLKLPPQFKIQKAYLVPKLPDKDWGGLIGRISADVANVASDILSGNAVGAVLSLGGQAVEAVVKLFDPSVGKYGVWVTEHPPNWPHYRAHWNNTCYTKSPRFSQALEYVGSFLVMGPEGLDPIPGWTNRQVAVEISK